MKIIPGDRLWNKEFIQKPAQLLQSKQGTRHSPRTCSLLYSSTSSLQLSLSPHFINHSPQKSHHTNIIRFQFVFGVIQKLNMAHHQGTRQRSECSAKFPELRLGCASTATRLLCHSKVSGSIVLPKLVPKPALWMSHMWKLYATLLLSFFQVCEYLENPAALPHWLLPLASNIIG